MTKKYSVDQKGLIEICTDIKSIPLEKQVYYYMELKKSKRSLEQIKMYWSIIEALMYFTDTGIVDKDVYHQYLKEIYASTHDSDKYFTKVTHTNGKKRLICTFSIDFSNCSQALFNSYMDFVAKYIIDNTSFSSAEEILDTYKEVI